VLDAAFALEHSDFLFVLGEMLMERNARDERERRFPTPAYPSDMFDDPFEDDVVPFDAVPFDAVPFDAVPAAIPSAPRRGRARKR
jgi:hypothetical protein